MLRDMNRFIPPVTSTAIQFSYSEELFCYRVNSLPGCRVLARFSFLVTNPVLWIRTRGPTWFCESHMEISRNQEELGSFCLGLLQEPHGTNSDNQSSGWPPGFRGICYLQSATGGYGALQA